MALTDKEIKLAHPREKEYKLYDGNGLLIRIRPNGTKIWQYKYRVTCGDKLKEKAFSLGVYDEVSLKEARQKCLDARKLDDPTESKKAEKRLARFNSDNTFKAVAEEWYKTNERKWTPLHAKKLWRRLELHILPAFGSRPISEITTLELLDALRKVEKPKKTDRKQKERDRTETTHRALQTCRVIFQFAVLTQKIKYNPANDLQGVLKSHKAVNYPTIGHNQLPDFFAKLNTVETSELNRLAIELLILTFVRQGELRRAKWTDFDFKKNEWRIRAETTKMRTEHLVPLSAQAFEILQKIRQITGQADYVFASQQSRKNAYMSENTINKVIHSMGYKGVLVGHGFRSTASTILNEKGFRPDVIERQLAHMSRDKVRAAYNRAEYLPERRKMMDWWGMFISQITKGSAFAENQSN